MGCRTMVIITPALLAIGGEATQGNQHALICKKNGRIKVILLAVSALHHLAWVSCQEEHKRLDKIEEVEVETL